MEVYTPLLVFLLFIQSSLSQHFYDCPSEWQVFERNCYHFVFFPEANYESARLKCAEDSAALVSINKFIEHNFVAEWITKHDPYQRSWFTSGMRRYDSVPGFIWKGDGTEAKPNAQFWLPGQPANNSNDEIITYTYGVTGYGWKMLPASDKLSYICEIKQSEAYRIVQHNRDFDFGMHVVDPNNLEKGPKFTKQPTSLVVVGTTLDGYLECVATGNPPPLYKWYKIDKNTRTPVTSASNSRYTLSNGKFTFHTPNEDEDAGDYQCESNNKFGVILSNTVTVSFGSMSEFNNVPDDAVRSDAYEGVAIQCSKLDYKPAVRYQWMKGASGLFVRPELQPHIFISNNGKLYFSEVTSADRGHYKCLAQLAGVNKHSIGTTQVPSKTSLPIELIVNENAAKSDWGPIIHNDFIAVFPQPPFRGQDVRMECFAFGSQKIPFTYTWTRKDKPIPDRTRYFDSNRIILIENAQLEDQGTYTCSVSSGHRSSDEKSLTLTLGADPYFIAPLQNEHVDIGAQLTWRCEARANPPAYYTWYKNGVQLHPVPGEMTIHGNVLTIEKLDSKQHDGMYQCGAANVHGKAFSSAQLRVLSFVPNFKRFPMSKVSDGSTGGNITLMCRPEGAPSPEITWFRNGALLGVGNGHYEQLANGYLLIVGLQKGDEGQYQCKAVNIDGEASDKTIVQVSSGTKITLPPSSTTVNVNSTAFIYCEASYEPHLDMVYTWKFNGYPLTSGQDPHIVIESTGNGRRNGLYILSAQQRHAGLYQCSSFTPLDSDSRAAYLTVYGPPGEPVGVYVDDDFVSQDSVHLRWTAGATNGRPISYYKVEYKTEHNPKWKVAIPNVLESDTIVDSQTKKMVLVEDLSPGTAYYFRVSAANGFGMGSPSVQSAAITTPHAPPTKPVQNVRGGGGSVGDLTIRWDPLAKDEQGGFGIGYIVYWRKLIDIEGSWRSETLKGNKDFYVHTVGKENYYLEYQVKVQAYNDEGKGLDSDIEVVYSAADMPTLTPTNVESDTYNGTALFVTWEPVADTRETAKGEILGYQINYWPDEGDYWLMNIRHEGQRDSGLVIGLESDNNFWVDVQMYNSAGLGPRSEIFMMETSRLPTASYPEEVRIMSHGHDSCEVWWRGITTTFDEALINGYRVYYWQARENALSAKTFDTATQQHTSAVLTGLEKDIVYALRVGGISAAGEGKKSQTIYFTLGGRIRLDQMMAESIQGFQADGNVMTSSKFVLMLCLLWCIV